MKRTEAIEWLEVMKENAIFEQYDALKMAIEALSIESSGDLISRADAIRGIQDGYCACVNDCINEINKLANATIDNTQYEWIVEHSGNGWNDWENLICPKCGEKHEKVPYYYNFCPKCGTRIKSGVKDI